MNVMNWNRLLLGIVFAGFTAVLVHGPAAADLIGHGGMIRAVDISDDGQKVLTGSFDYSAIVWNFGDQQDLVKLVGHQGPVNSVQFVGHGARALTGSDDKTLILWDVSTGLAIFHLTGHDGKVTSLDVSGDYRFAVSGGWDGKVILWDLTDGSRIRVIRADGPVNSVVYLGNTGKIAVAGHNRSIQVFETSSGKLLGRMDGHQMAVTQLSASSDGRQLLSASIDGSVRLWDPASFRPLARLDGHEHQVYSVQFVAGDKYAVSAGRDGTIVLWDIETRQKRRTIIAHRSIVWAVAGSPDGRFVISASSDETARVWHLASGDRIGTEVHVDTEPRPWMQSDHPGARLYRKCARCHAYRADLIQRSGPHLENLFGRRAGSVSGYHYSDALARRSFVWDEKTVFELFDKGPDVYLPGTKMPVQKVTDEEQLHELVEYLKLLTSSGQPGPKSVQ